jgi:hypothetical protein
MAMNIRPAFGRMYSPTFGAGVHAVTDWNDLGGGVTRPDAVVAGSSVQARPYALSASSLSHAERPFGLAFRLYPAFSCGVQRKPTRALAGFLMGGLPLGFLG